MEPVTIVDIATSWRGLQAARPTKKLIADPGTRDLKVALTRRKVPPDDGRQIALDALGNGIGPRDDRVLQRARALASALVGQPLDRSRNDLLRGLRIGNEVLDDHVHR